MKPYHEMTIEELRALFRTGRGMPRMSQIWQYLQWRETLCTMICNDASEIARLDIAGTPAEGRIISDLKTKGVVFDDPERSHKPWKCNKFGYWEIVQ